MKNHDVCGLITIYHSQNEAENWMTKWADNGKRGEEDKKKKNKQKNTGALNYS